MCLYFCDFAPFFQVYVKFPKVRFLFNKIPSPQRVFSKILPAISNYNAPIYIILEKKLKNCHESSVFLRWLVKFCWKHGGGGGFCWIKSVLWEILHKLGVKGRSRRNIGTIYFWFFFSFLVFLSILWLSLIFQIFCENTNLEIPFDWEKGVVMRLPLLTPVGNWRVGTP